MSEDLEALKQAQADLNAKVAALQAKRRAEAASATPSETVDLLKALVEIARFAVANNPPQTTHNLPAPAFRVVADAIERYPQVLADPTALAIAFRSFADKVDHFDANRDRDIRRQVVRDASSGLVRYTCEWCAAKLEFGVRGCERAIRSHVEGCPERDEGTDAA